MALSRELETSIRQLGQSAAERVNKKTESNGDALSRIVAQVTAVNTSARTIDTAQMAGVPYTSACTNIAKDNTVIISLANHQAVCIGVLNEAAPTWKEVYPVGAVYISYVSTSPASLFGGTWTQITGRFLRMANDVSTGGADSITHWHYQTIGATNDSTTIYLMDGQHTYGHTGTIAANTYTPNYRTTMTGTAWQRGILRRDGTADATTNNMPAYQDLYAWRRTA